MKVKDVLAILADLDPEANVLLATQPSYPMESTLGGVAVRSEVSEVSESDDTAAGPQPNDVLLLEGSHVRYGTRAAWDPSRAQR